MMFFDAIYHILYYNSSMDTVKEYARRKGLRYHVITYGCQMNDHESEKLCGILEHAGYTKSTGSEDADLILFNTCCIRDNAEQKVYGNIGALKKQKEENPALLLIVSGCMTQQKEAAKKMARVFPFVDIILGTHNQYELEAAIKDRIFDKKKTRAHAEQKQEIAEDTPVLRAGWPLAAVNIMYGCDNFCSYCIVPYVRGRERSRSPEKILREIDSLTQDGYKEVMLLGQNVNSYRGAGDMTFPKLLARICADTKIDRIRFMTSHPKDLSDELLTVMAGFPRICKHIHLPVQSGSTKILAAMNRGYTREGYLELIGKIRRTLPGCVLTTDIIAGFPGEDDQDFAQTARRDNRRGLIRRSLLCIPNEAAQKRRTCRAWLKKRCSAKESCV